MSLPGGRCHGVSQKSNSDINYISLNLKKFQDSISMKNISFFTFLFYTKKYYAVQMLDHVTLKTHSINSVQITGINYIIKYIKIENHYFKL